VSVPRSLGSSNTLVSMQRVSTSSIGKIGTDTGNYRSITLGSFPGNSDVFALFQEYRIKSITMTYHLVTANANAEFPTLYVAPQHFATFLAPSNREEMLQFQDVTVFQFSPTSTKLVKKWQPWTYLDTESSGRHFVKSPWISTVSLDVKHFFSVEWITRYSALFPTHVIEFTLEADVECRGTR
jgi:hypothetical protein